MNPYTGLFRNMLKQYEEFEMSLMKAADTLNLDLTQRKIFKEEVVEYAKTHGVTALTSISIVLNEWSNKTSHSEDQNNCDTDKALQSLEEGPWPKFIREQRESKPKGYVVGMVFNHDMSMILLLLRSKEPYQGQYNGVGGKIEDGESPYEAMVREFKEEVQEVNGRSPIPIKIKPLVSMTFSSEVELNVFYIILGAGEEKNINVVTDEGILIWTTPATVMDASNYLLAGEGNISYFVNYALILEGKQFTHQPVDRRLLKSYLGV